MSKKNKGRKAKAGSLCLAIERMRERMVAFAVREHLTGKKKRHRKDRPVV